VGIFEEFKEIKDSKDSEVWMRCKEPDDVEN
jgi:hypothetical protein